MPPVPPAPDLLALALGFTSLPFSPSPSHHPTDPHCIGNLPGLRSTSEPTGVPLKGICKVRACLLVCVYGKSGSHPILKFASRPGGNTCSPQGVSEGERERGKTSGFNRVPFPSHIGMPVAWRHRIICLFKVPHHTSSSSTTTTTTTIWDEY